MKIFYFYLLKIKLFTDPSQEVSASTSCPFVGGDGKFGQVIFSQVGAVSFHIPFVQSNGSGIHFLRVHKQFD